MPVVEQEALGAGQASPSGVEAEAGGAGELSPQDAERVEAVLSGQLAYDDLGDSRLQAIVRDKWLELLSSDIDKWDLQGEFEAEGRPYAELDENGQVVIRNPAETAPH